MNIIKYTLVMGTLSIATISNAQSKKTNEKLVQKSIEKTNKLHKEVKLTKVQSEKIKVINLEYYIAKKELEDKLKALKKSKNKKIAVILTDDQKEKLESLKKKKKK